jgi:hypothetical protein
MTRLITGLALSLILVGATSALAANSSTTNYRARCTSLAEQWKTAEASNATHVSLGKAKADAAKGEKLCKSTKTADQKKGVADYEMALKLLGMTPS